MYELDTYYAFFRGGHCYGITPKMLGKGSTRWNERTRESFGLAEEVRELPRDEAAAAHRAYLAGVV